jgi:hypothetical protein
MLLLASSLHRATGIFEISLETLPFEIERVPPYGRCMAQLSPPAHIHRRTSAGRRNGNQCREEGACALRHGQGGHGHRSSFLQEQIKGIIIIRASWRGPLAARARPGMAQGLEKLGAKPIVAKLHREQGKITIDAAAGQDDASRRFRFPSLASLSSPSCKTSRP